MCLVQECQAQPPEPDEGKLCQQDPCVKVHRVLRGEVSEGERGAWLCSRRNCGDLDRYESWGLVAVCATEFMMSCCVF